MPEAMACRMDKYKYDASSDELTLDDREEVNLTPIRSQEAEAALRALAEAASVEAQYPKKETNPFLATASGQSLEAAVQQLKLVFGDNIELFFDEDEKRLFQTPGGKLADPPPSPGFVRVLISNVRFIDRDGRRSGLNLNGLRAPILLIMERCRLWYLLLHNADLFGLDLRDLQSKPPPSAVEQAIAGWTNGVWFAGIGLQVSAYLDVDDCHFSVFILPGLKTRRLRMERSVKIDLGKQVVERQIIKIPAIISQLNELSQREQDPSEDGKLLHEAKKRDNDALNFALNDLIANRSVIDISYGTVGEVYFSAQCDSCANFKGTVVQGSFEIDGGSFVDPFWNLRNEFRVLDLARIEQILGEEAPTNSFNTLKAWIYNPIAMPVIDFTDLRVDGRLALLDQRGRQKQQDDCRIVGFVDFNGAKCRTFAHDPIWWKSATEENKLLSRLDQNSQRCYELRFFEYQFIDLWPIATRDPFFNSSVKDSPSQSYTWVQSGTRQRTGERLVKWLSGAFCDRDDELNRLDMHPWTQCAAALRRAGNFEDAEHVLYEREMIVRGLDSESLQTLIVKSLISAIPLLYSAMIAVLLFSPIDMIGIARSLSDHPWTIGFVAVAISSAAIYVALIIWDIVVRNLGRQSSGNRTFGQSTLENLGNRFLSLTIGFGYKSRRALAATTITLCLGAYIFHRADSSEMFYPRPGEDFDVEARNGQEISAEARVTRTALAIPSNGSPNYSPDLLVANRENEMPGQTAPINGTNQAPCCNAVTPDEIQGAVASGMSQALNGQNKRFEEAVSDAVERGIRNAGSNINVQENPLLFSLNRMFPVLDLIVGSQQIPKPYIKRKMELHRLIGGSSCCGAIIGSIHLSEYGSRR